MYENCPVNLGNTTCRITSWVQNHPNEPNKTQLSQGTVTGLKEIDMGRKSGWFVIILMIINVDILNDIVVKVGYSFCSC